MKKVISILAVLIMALSVTSIGASAHGGHGGGHGNGNGNGNGAGNGGGVGSSTSRLYQHLGNGGRNSLYGECPVDGCEVTGRHQHDGNWYCNQQGAYTPCPVDGCEQVGRHQHNDNWYCGQQGGSGATCPIGGCTQPGTHQHNGSGHGRGNVSHGRGRK